MELSEREMRQVAAGQLPRRLQREAAHALIWFDDGIAAGLRDQQRRRRRRMRQR